MIEVLIDELQEASKQEVVLVYKNIKQNLEKTTEQSSRGKIWNIATLQKEFYTGLIVNSQRDDNKIYMYYFCGH
jgi:ribosomal protein L18E